MREVIVFFYGGGHAKIQYRRKTAFTQKTASAYRVELLKRNIFKNVITAVADDYMTKTVYEYIK